ncbi:MAG: tetratricopeptide repeat protein [Spirochaetaceae bacterium]|jgi:tetratricopeptide (TPR) repeat protein|nr:tetratricopeptide repeat protein [Spirochaetaceae bacterium]
MAEMDKTTENETDSLIQQIEAVYDTGDYAKAFECFSKAKKQIESSASIPAFASLRVSAAFGGLYKRRPDIRRMIDAQETDAAISDYSKAIALNSSDADTYYNRGLAYNRKEQWDSAITDFSKAILYDPDNAEYYYRRSEGYRRTSQERLARPDLEKALQLDPAHKGAKATLQIMNLMGYWLTLNNKQYLVICNKIIDNCECLLVGPRDSPENFKLLKIRDENDGELHAELYDKEDEQEIIQESLYEITASLNEIREMIKRETPGGKDDNEH